MTEHVQHLRQFVSDAAHEGLLDHVWPQIDHFFTVVEADAMDFRVGALQSMEIRIEKRPVNDVTRHR